MKSKVLIFLLLCGAASAQIINPSGGTGSGFTAPTGWSTSGNKLVNTVTENVTSGTALLYATTWTPTITAGADAKAFGITSNMAGGANTGSTWANTYNVCNFNVTSGTGLTHPLCDIQRSVFTSTAAIPISLGTAGYFTAGMTNVNGPVGDLQILHTEWDSGLSGTGTFSGGMIGIVGGVPGAITGNPTVPYVIGVEAGDVTNAGVPGTTKCAFSAGLPSVSGTYGLCIPTPLGTYTNPIMTGTGVNWFSGGFITGPLQSLHGSLSANTKIEVSNNNTDTMIGFYNANGGLWETGIGSGANGEYVIKNTARSVTSISISKTDSTITFGETYKSTTGTRFLCVNSSGVMSASASACSGT